MDKGADFYFQDKRWMDEAGDIDINVSEESLDVFDSVLRRHGFVFKSGSHPDYLFYNKFSRGEMLKLHLQIGNYEGLPFGVLDPETVTSAGSYYLPRRGTDLLLFI